MSSKRSARSYVCLAGRSQRFATLVSMSVTSFMHGGHMYIIYNCCRNSLILMRYMDHDVHILQLLTSQVKLQCCTITSLFWHMTACYIALVLHVHHLCTGVRRFRFCLHKCVWPLFRHLWVLRRRTNHCPCCPPMSNPSISPWTAQPDGSGWWDNWMAAQHLPWDTIVILAEYATPKTTRIVSFEKTQIPMMSLK